MENIICKCKLITFNINLQSAYKQMPCRSNIEMRKAPVDPMIRPISNFSPIKQNF